jgi:hypothetical protein
MIPLRCSAYDCFEMPMLAYTINRKKIYRCQNHPIKCHTKNCPRNPTISFNHRNKTIFYCGRHGKANQINICKNIHCNTIATYGTSNCQKPICCIKHKSSNMEITVSQCCYFGCHEKATYNYLPLLKESRNPKGIYCNNHKSSKMISIDEFNNGYLVKQVNPKKEEDTKYDVNKQDIIREEMKTNTYDIKETKSEKNTDESFSLIYDMRNDTDVHVRSVLNEYVIVE